jgi:hypothetical protein
VVLIASTRQAFHKTSTRTYHPVYEAEEEREREEKKRFNNKKYSIMF